jgi:hypothetical protein
MAASVSNTARLSMARMRVATGGSVTSSWMALSAMLFQFKTWSTWTTSERVRVLLRVLLLPAASVTFSTMALAPLARATPASWKAPVWLAVALRPW